MYRLLHVFVAATVGFHVQDARIWGTLTDGKSALLRYIDPEQRQVRRSGAPWWGEGHEVFQAPVLFGIPEVELDLEPQAIVVHEWRVGQFQVTAEQDDMGTGLGAQVGLGDDDDIQGLRVCFRRACVICEAS